MRLLNRTTRTVQPTPEGAEFYERCKRIVGELEQAEQSLSRSASLPAGSLRIGMPSALGRLWVIPRLPAFLASYPAISLEIMLDDFITGVVSEGLDAAIQLGDLPPSRLTVRKLAAVDYVVCAAPAYLAANGRPVRPADLAGHRCITYRRPRNGQIRRWRLKGVPQKELIPKKGFMTFNSGEGLISAATAGIGLIQIGRIYAQPHLDSGALVEVLHEHRVHAYDISLLFPSRSADTPRLRVFIDYLVGMFSPPPWEQTTSPPAKSRRA